MVSKINVALTSFHDENSFYPSRYSLSSMRLLSAIMEKVDAKVIPISLSDPIDELYEKTKSFDVVCYSSYMWTRDKLQKIIMHGINKNDSRNIFIGGPDVSNLDEKILGKETFIIDGEGEIPLLEKLNEIQDNGKIKHKGNPKVNNLDNLSPMLLNSTTPLFNGAPMFSKRFMDNLVSFTESDLRLTYHDTSVGCKYRCGYCGHKTREKVVLREEAMIFEEIKNIGAARFNRIFIVDPLFGGGEKDRELRLLKSYRKLCPDSKLRLYYRPEDLTDESINELRKSNIEEVQLGLQTINPNVPGWLRNNNLERSKANLIKLTNCNVPSRIELMVGLPGDTLQGLKDSMKFVINELKPSCISTYHLTVIPNTPIYNLLTNPNQGMWVMSDKQGRAHSSHSYSNSELKEMLKFSYFLSSYYNNNFKVTGEPIEYKKLEQIYRS